MKRIPTVTALVASAGLLACGGGGGGERDGDAGDAAPDETIDTTTETPADAPDDPGTDTVTDPGTDTTPPPGGYCEPLPMPTEGIISVTTADMGTLDSIVGGASTGETVVLEDGTYTIDGQVLHFATPGVTLRSASGNREAVVIDANYGSGEIALISASDVTIADVTLREATWHPIHVVSTDEHGVTGTLIYNVHVIDPGQQAIKVNPHEARVNFVDDGEVACSRITMTDDGRPHVSGCYTGGFDAHWARGWIIRDSIWEGFWCPSGLSEHGIHLWTGSRDTVVERNVLIDNARGIGFGLGESGVGRTYTDDPCPGASYVGHFGGVIRNNFVVVTRPEVFSSDSGFDCGICVEQACGVQILHNTVVATQPPASSSIEWRFPNTDATIRNNLATHGLLRRNDASPASLGPSDGNLESASISLVEDPSIADLHLVSTAAEAIDQGVVLGAGMCTHDIDGDERDSSPDIGADEFTE